MTTRIPAEVFPPGEFIKDELEARNWTQADLAEIFGLTVKAANEIIAGKKAITPETARGLGDAFGTGPELWLNLENAYRLSRTPPPDEAVARRAQLYEKAPIKEMIRRGWVAQTDDLDELEASVSKFFELRSIRDEPTLSCAARKGSNYAETSASERAWCFRAKRLAEEISVDAFDPGKLTKAILLEFRQLARAVEGVRDVPTFLGRLGIRYVIVEHLKSSRIDGAAIWLDERSPVVAMSLRYDRIDNFWFVLAHELAHVVNGDRSVDNDLVGTAARPTDEKPEFERKADRMAASLLVPTKELAGFIARHRPRFSKQAVCGFASQLGVHPGIVVGQLQHRGEISYSHSREMLLPVRRLITEVAITDGWA